MSSRVVAHPSVEERKASGRDARDRTPRSVHSGWEPAADHPEPVALLEAQNATREPDLVPVRHGRMMVSAFTFYRGAAKITDFAERLATGNEQDHQAFLEAVKAGRIPAVEGV